MEASFFLLLAITIVTVAHMRAVDPFPDGTTGRVTAAEITRVSTDHSDGTVNTSAVSTAAWEQYAWPAGQRIIDALTARISRTPDGTTISFDVGPHGHLRHPAILRSSGDRRLDDMIVDQILPGMKLDGLPPPSLRMPLVMRFSIMDGGWVYSLEQASS